MITKDNLQEEVIELAEKIKAAYAPTTEVCELAERINAVILESDEQKEALTITKADQISILEIMANYGVYVDIKERLFETLSACLEDPSEETFEMFDEIAAEINLYSGELVYYLS